MNRRPIVLGLLATAFLLITILSCSNKSTDSKTRTMSDDEAMQVIDENELDMIGIQVIGVAITQAASNWKGYTEPNVDDYLGGFGKIAATHDTVLSYEYLNGWHIFYARLTMVESEDDFTLTYDITGSDSTQFKVDGVALPFPENPDFLDERAHIDVNLETANDTSSASVDLLAYIKAVLQLITEDNLRLDLAERFTFGMDATMGGQGSMSGIFTYDVASTDLMFSSADDFTCPISGAITLDISLRVSDGTQTATASGMIEVVIAEGDATVAVTVGTYTETNYYADICENQWASPSFESIVESMAK
jgi:hypothetical protein